MPVGCNNYSFDGFNLMMVQQMTVDISMHNGVI